jgi:hypothetical protein
MMQRYALHHYPCRAFNSDIIEKDDGGGYVLYSDAQAEIEKRDKEIARLRVKVDRLRDLLDDVDDSLSKKHDCP